MHQLQHYTTCKTTLAHTLLLHVQYMRNAHTLSAVNRATRCLPCCCTLDVPQRRVRSCICANCAQRCIQLPLPRLAGLAVAAHQTVEHVFQSSAATGSNAGLAVTWHWCLEECLQQKLL
jgi:hypothetical protein